MKCVRSVLHIKRSRVCVGGWGGRDVDQQGDGSTLCLSNYWLLLKLFGEKHSTYFWAQSATALNAERLGTTCDDKDH